MATTSATEQWLVDQIALGSAASGTVAVVDGAEVRTFGAGRTRADNGSKPDSHTQYQIGSITKPYTFLLLAELAQAGLIRYETTLGELLPKKAKPVNSALNDVTLLQLATHRSGLPRLPFNLQPLDASDPYAAYDEKALWKGVSGSRALQPLGSYYAYSNFGVGLLGFLLGLSDGAGYHAALERHVLAKLNGADTGFNPRADRAAGHSGGREVPDWSMHDSLAAAGALWSSAHDLAELVQVYTGVSPNPFLHDYSEDLAIIGDNGDGFLSTRVWHVAMAGEVPVYWHNGGTGGFRSFVGFRTDTRQGVAILVSGDADPTASGLAALGLSEEPRPTSSDIDRTMEGQYTLTPSFGIGVFVEDGVLLAQATGQPALALYRVSDEWYAIGDADASIRFVRENGKVTALQLAQNNRLQTAARSADAADRQRYVVINVDSVALDEYVGTYAFGRKAQFSIRRSGNGIEAMLTGQSFLPIYPYGKDRFFYKVVDAQLSFERDEDGAIRALILHQGGVEQRAERER